MSRRSRGWSKLAVGLAVLLTSTFGVLLPNPASAHDAGTNGCTLVPDSSYFFDFHEVCDDHDLCYLERPYGASSEARARCDREFYSAMKDSCKDMWPKRRDRFARGICYAVAGTYYAGVRAFGGFGWDSSTTADMA